MIPHAFQRYRRESAQNRGLRNRCLANALECTTVMVVGSVSIPALFADYLFRTPSLNGQVIVIGDSLPVSFGRFSETGHRHGLAHPDISCVFTLRPAHRPGHVLRKATRPQEGWAKCEQHIFGRCCYSAAGLQPAAIARANRRSMARARASWARRSWTPTFTGALRPARRPTCCTAISTRASATDPAVADRFPLSNRACLTADCRQIVDEISPAQTQWALLNNAKITVVGRCADSGVFRSTSTLTKDTPCSIRS